MTPMDLLGILGSIILSSSTIPQVLKIKKTGGKDVSSLMLWLWWSGIIIMMIYVFGNNVLFLNYAFNFVMISLMLAFKKSK